MSATEHRIGRIVFEVPAPDQAATDRFAAMVHRPLVLRDIITQQRQLPAPAVVTHGNLPPRTRLLSH